MNLKISEITDQLFNGIPYSEATEKAKSEISESLDKEYESALENKNEIQALGQIMSDYGTLESAASISGYTNEDVSAWKSGNNTVDLPSAKKAFGKARRRIYAASFFFMCVFSYVFSLVAWQNPFFLLLIAAAAAIGLLFVKKSDKIKKQFSIANSSYLCDAYEFLRIRYDKYAKRLINSTVLLFCLGAYLIFIILNMNMKFEEGMQNLFSYVYIFGAFVYVFCKNLLCKRFVDSVMSKEITEKYHSQVRKITLVSAVYWVIALTALIVLGRGSEMILNWFLAVMSLYLIALLVYDLTVRKSLVFRNIVINKKRIAVFGVAAAVCFTYNFMQLDSYYIQPYISTVSPVSDNKNEISYNDDTGVYTITSDGGDFKILQLTDIHLGGSAVSATKDLKALEACSKLIQYTKPDFVIITGDLTFPMGIMSFSVNNYTPVRQFCEFMRNIGVPWAFTYGNHDTESMATNSAEEIDELFKSLSYKTSGNLLYPYTQPGIYGRSNQMIEIRNSDGSLNQALFLIDSNSYTGSGVNDYDYIHDDQVDWYKRNVERLNEEEGKDVSSMLFFHIPLQEYRTAYELYEQGSGEVKYFFGENGEEMIDKVCCSDYPSKLFDTAEELGSTKAMFCGHDHYNNLSVEYRGIRLTYGMSIDYLAMPGINKDTEQRGATLITLRENSDFDIEQIKLTDIQ